MGHFGIGDVRVSARGEWLFERIVSTGSVVLRQLGETRSGEVAAHRYLSSQQVTASGIVSGLSERTARACAGRRVVAAQDTTEINFARRGRPPAGLGPGGDGESRGFFIHPVVAVDVEEEAVLGLVDARIWTRGEEPAPPRRGRAIEDKESLRWIEGTRAAADALAGAAELVVVADREGDIYSHFARCPAAADLVVRARHDRALATGGSLYEAVAARPALGAAAVAVAPRGPGDKGRVATVTLRAAEVEIARPATAGEDDPATLRLGVVEAREESPPAGVKPLLWRLATTLPAADLDAARGVIRLYRLRWRIEQVFRGLKRDGLKLEDTQIREAGRLFRLTALALGAAVRIIQLVDARDGSPRPMSDVLDETMVEAVAALGRTREGATARQQNPHPRGSLAWLAWIVARYGGWNCYYKPPGPKTMAIGWERFVATLSGYILANADADL